MPAISLKNFSSALLLTFALSSIQSTPAHALVGVALGNIPLAAAGGGIAALSIFGGMNENMGGPIFAKTLLLGLVALDDKATVSPSFAPLSSEDAVSLNVGEDDRVAYNSELSEINAITETIAKEALGYNQPKTSAEEVSKFIEARWEQYSGMLSVNAYSVVQKIQTNLNSNLVKH